MGVQTFTVNSSTGAPVPLAEYREKVLLIVNTASACFFARQFKDLQALHQEFHAKGLEILAFPCNQFGAQEPLNADEIEMHCDEKYGVSFPLFGQVEVNGIQADPLFKYLQRAAPGLLGSTRIKWNFTKFLIRKDGTPYKRYAPHTSPAAIADDIRMLLKE
jgi:glutathione peroxidase